MNRKPTYAELREVTSPHTKYIAWCDVSDQPAFPRNFRLYAYGDTEEAVRADMAQMQQEYVTGPVDWTIEHE